METEKERQELSVRKIPGAEPSPYRCPALRGIISELARNGIPADTWIDQYTVSRDHAALMKLDYYRQTVAQKGDMEIANRYRDEVAEELVDGSDINNRDMIIIAQTFWKMSDSSRVKDRILERIGKSRMTYSMIHNLIAFADSALEDYEGIEEHQVRMLDERIKMFGNAIQGDESFSHYQKFKTWNAVGEVRMHMAHYLGAQATDLIGTIDKHAKGKSSLLHNTKTDTEGWITGALIYRNDYLAEYARISAKAGDYTRAKAFLDLMDDAHKRSFTTGEIASGVVDVEHIEMLKPDDLSLALDPNLGKILDVRKKIVSGTADEVMEIALTKPFKVVMDCVNSQLDKDLAAGQVFATELIRRIQARGKGSEFLLEKIAREQHIRGNDDAAQVRFDNAAFLLPSIAFGIYTEIAKLTEPEKGIKVTQELGIARAEVDVYVEDDGSIYDTDGEGTTQVFRYDSTDSTTEETIDKPPKFDERDIDDLE